MDATMVRFPVTCPICDRESLLELPLVDVAEALLTGQEIKLHAPCHGCSWSANEIEVQQVREYLGAI
jgi:hypothetical protein